jgi:hypothetical protein
VWGGMTTPDPLPAPDLHVPVVDMSDPHRQEQARQLTELLERADERMAAERAAADRQSRNDAE